MYLTFPQSDISFNANPAFVIGVFDVYDREETLGKELGKLNPNDPADLSELLEKCFFPRWSDSHGFSAQHRKAIVESLIEALEDESYDFSSLLRADYKEFALPDAWKIENPRSFFIRCYGEIFKRWGTEFASISYQPTLPNALQTRC